MRIVGGTARRQVLAAPKSDDVIRPTADRVRETIFNVLGQTCDGLTVLDLYAGTGALGLEAVSRGAIKAVLVDRGREALELCKLNATTLKLIDRVEIIAADAQAAIANLARQHKVFELVFADPPYNHQVGQTLLHALMPVVSDDGVAVIETGRDEVMPESVAGFTRIDQRTFGTTTVSIFRLTARSP